MPEPAKTTVFVEMRYSNGDIYRLTGDAANAWHRAVVQSVNVSAVYGYPFQAQKLQYVPPPQPGEGPSPIVDEGQSAQ